MEKLNKFIAEMEMQNEYVKNRKLEFAEFSTSLNRTDMETLNEFVDDSLNGRMLLGRFLLVRGSNSEVLAKLSNMLKSLGNDKSVSVYDNLEQSDEATFIVQVDKKALPLAESIGEYERQMIPGYGTNYVLFKPDSEIVSPGLANRAKVITVN